MPQTPYISVIVPVYNVELYIKLCIDSILTQTFQDFEIIIVDDAATDNSYNVCQKFYGGNEKVRIIRHEKNQGLGPARNTGIANARGKYIYFVNGDDAILPNALEFLYNIAEKSGADVVHTSRYYETTQDDDKPLVTVNFTLEQESHNAEGFLPPDIFYRLQNYWQKDEPTENIKTMAWLNFCRREFFEKYPIHFESIMDEEKIFSLELLAYAQKFLTINQAVYVHRSRFESFITKWTIENFCKGILSLNIITRKLETLFDNFSKLKGNETFVENFIFKVGDNFFKEHIQPFYQNEVPDVLNATTTKFFKELFGENTPLAKFFFNVLTSYGRQLDILTQQNKQMQGIIQSLNQTIHLYSWENTNFSNLLNEMELARKKISQPFENLCHVNYEYLVNLSYAMNPNDYDQMLNRIFDLTVEKIRRKDKIKIAFATYNAAMWCGDNLYHYFADNPRYEVKVYFCSDISKGNTENRNNEWRRSIEKFKSRGINVIGLDNANSTIEKQDVIIFLNPYLGAFPKAFQLSELTAETLLVNIPYGFAISNFNIFNMEMFHVLWKHFFESTQSLEKYKTESTVPIHGYYSGYPRMDVLVDKNSNLKYDWKMTRPDAIKIIYAPHWSIGDLAIRYATFHYNWKFFYEFAKAHPEISWVVKPHPHLFHATVELLNFFPSEDAFKSYMQAWDDLPNAKVETGAYYHEIFATSDGMILDSGSFIMEYQYTHKPMIFLTRETQQFNDLVKELMQVTYRVDGRDFDGIAQMIQKIFIEGKDEMYSERMKFFDKYCDYVKTNGILASEYIYKNISNELSVK